MAFNPRSEYTIISKEFAIDEFHRYKDEFVTRPPYQRKAVWPKSKKQSLMDSLFRRYYIPKLVIREVRLSKDKTVNEIIDGQQRITTVQDFFANKYPLPKSLKDIDERLVGAYYSDLESEFSRFIDRSLKYQADVIKNIEEPNNVDHQIIATEIFWRLQQGESLNYMEVAHAQLSSLSRNYLVKYADDQTFDYDQYKPLDENPEKLPFFSLLNVDNNRMKHLQFMARFTMIEKEGGYADLSDKKITTFVEEQKKKDGIGNYSYESEKPAQEVIKNLKHFYKIFKDDPMLDEKNGIKELSVEYFIISTYLLISHLRKHYVLDDDANLTIRNFIYYFHNRWKTYDESNDTDLLSFSNRRQQGENDLQVRDRIMRQLFFNYLQSNNLTIISLDGKRAFSELQRIQLYRRDKGLCQACLREEKSEKEAVVSWSNYQADHVFPHSKGGRTELQNAELLCSYHNQSKGAKVK